MDLRLPCLNTPLPSPVLNPTTPSPPLTYTLGRVNEGLISHRFLTPRRPGVRPSSHLPTRTYIIRRSATGRYLQGLFFTDYSEIPFIQRTVERRIRYDNNNFMINDSIAILYMHKNNNKINNNDDNDNKHIHWFISQAVCSLAIMLL